MIRNQIPALTPLAALLALAIAAAAAAIALTACTGIVPTPSGTDTRPAAVQAYATCWADTAKSQDANPPANTFNTSDASMLRCRHLRPGPDYWLTHNITGGRLPVPRYRYSVADHEICLSETVAWFRGAHPDAGASHPHLFAEIICAVPPPVYTNVPED